MKAYHKSNSYKIGDDLMSLYRLHDRDEVEATNDFLSRWPEMGVEEASYHIMYVHLYATLEDAINSDIEGEIFEIDLDYVDYTVDTIEFTHPMVRDTIAAEYISRVI